MKQRGGTFGETIIITIVSRCLVYAVLKFIQSRRGKETKLDIDEIINDHSMVLTAEEIQQLEGTPLIDCDLSFEMVEKIKFQTDKRLYTTISTSEYDRYVDTLITKIIGILSLDPTAVLNIPGLLQSCLKLLCVHLYGNQHCKDKKIYHVSELLNIVDLDNLIEGIKKLNTVQLIKDVVKDVVKDNLKTVLNITNLKLKEGWQLLLPTNCNTGYFRLKDVSKRISEVPVKTVQPTKKSFGIMPFTSIARTKGYTSLSGGKRESYKPTTMVHKGSDGKKYKVYEKQGRYYIRKRNKNDELRYYCVKPRTM